MGGARSYMLRIAYFMFVISQPPRCLSAANILPLMPRTSATFLVSFPESTRRWYSRPEPKIYYIYTRVYIIIYIGDLPFLNASRNLLVLSCMFTGTTIDLKTRQVSPSVYTPYLILITADYCVVPCRLQCRGAVGQEWKARSLVTAPSLDRWRAWCCGERFPEEVLTRI